MSAASSPEVSLGSPCDWQKFNQVVRAQAVPTTGKVGLALLLMAMVRLRVTTGHFEYWELRCDLREHDHWNLPFGILSQSLYERSRGTRPFTVWF